MSLRLFPAGLLAAAFVASPSAAQFDNQWATFAEDASVLGLDPEAISSNDTEIDFAWGDLDHNGLTDLVVVRKQPFTTMGKRTNILFMNEEGRLVDRTADLVQSTIIQVSPGQIVIDNGFLSATNDRDVVIVDVDNDGMLDVVTATTLSDNDEKYISHPRIYMNQGFEASGGWRGLKYEPDRIPQFFTVGGAPVAPRFCSVHAGDVTGNGYADLYFGDYDGSEVFPTGSNPGNDLNDRLLINDGTGFFTDESSLRMSSLMLLSAFGNSVKVADMNLDGMADIVKGTSLQPPQQVSISYNDPNDEGFFNIFDPFHAGFQPYFQEVGDLNNDGRPDVLISDDGIDRYRYNEDVDVFGRVVWSAPMTFEFLSGSDDGFGGNNWIEDLDGDGFGEAIVTDVDVDIPGCSRRTHIYHNPGGEPGSQPRLIEEREMPGNGGWIGAVGFTADDLRGAHDVAVFDVENDGDMDVILGRCVGTFTWLNQRFEGTCQADIGFGGPGNARLSMCGQELSSGSSADLRVHSAPPMSPAFIVASFFNNPTPLLGGTIIVVPPEAIVTTTTDAYGTAVVEDVPGGSGPATVYAQAAVVDLSQPDLFTITNALELEYLP